MFGILDTLEEWIRDLLISMITSNLTNLFDDVNTKVGTIATEVGQTPQGWNSGIFNMVKSLSDNVIVPIAGLIITFVLCYELITAITEKNNMHDVDTFIFFKYVFKAFVAVYLLSHTFDITMAVFDVAQTVVNHAGGLITNNTSIDITATIASMQTEMETMELGGLVQLALETAIISLTLKIMSILITVILYGRMIEIYLTVSVAPIPFATMTNREWGNIGTNYFKSLFALGFQGFFMMVCVAIYAVLVNAMTISSDIHMALFSIAAYTVILCLSLLKTSSLSRSIFGAH
ncbi:MAG: CD0415/CD1112 family protein [Clostridiales bacterium]|nr:CD0415/CD1112 family protein [Clostridiales bacterium]